MTIISPTDFRGQQNIPGISNPGTFQNVKIFIDKYEDKFLKELLGASLAAEFIAALVPVEVVPATNPITYVPILPKWLYLRNQTDLKPMLINYIYYWYIRNEVTFTAVTGEAKTENENSTRVSSVDKQFRAWNEMVDMARSFTLDLAIYPNYVVPVINEYFGYGWYSFHSRCRVKDIYIKISALNL